MRCEEARELFDEYYARELSASGIQNFEGHLKMCPDCEAEYEEFKKYKAMMKSLGDVAVPEGFANDVMEKIRREKIVAMAPVKKKWYKSVRVYGAAAAACVILAVFAGGKIDQYIKLSDSPQTVPTDAPAQTQMLTQAPQNSPDAASAAAPKATQQPGKTAEDASVAPKTAKPKPAAAPKTALPETTQQVSVADGRALEQETFETSQPDSVQSAPLKTEAPEKENVQTEQPPVQAPAPSPAQPQNTKSVSPNQPNDASVAESSGGSGSSGLMAPPAQDADSAMPAAAQAGEWLETICTYRIVSDNSSEVLRLLEGKTTQDEIDAVLNENKISFTKTVTVVDHSARYNDLEEKLQNGDNSEAVLAQMQEIRDRCAAGKICFEFIAP